MERQFLIKYLVILIALAGCQQLEVNDSNINIDNNQKLIKNSSNNNNSISDEVVTPYLNVWEYLIKNASSNEDVINDQILFYMNVHLKDIDKFSEYLNDSYYFIYFVINELEKANLPIELALLPYIESNYDPFSISSSGAVGILSLIHI